MTKPSGQSSVVKDLEQQIAELKRQPGSAGAAEEIQRLEEELQSLRAGGGATENDAWRRVLLARHPQRPYTLDYIQILFTDFMELHGDRRFGDDHALVAGFARFEGRAVAVVGHQKGRDTKQKLIRNFGMTNPEGYRKALRVMRLASKFGLPIITFIDTPGAYPGIGAEERGQAEAIAYNLKEIPKLRGSDHSHHSRRRRQRRSAGNRCGRLCADAGKRRLFRNRPGKLLVDSLARLGA